MGGGKKGVLWLKVGKKVMMVGPMGLDGMKKAAGESQPVEESLVAVNSSYSSSKRDLSHA